jgi:hypothetical protein
MEFDRKNAFSMKIDALSGSEDDPIQYLIPLENKLYAFADNTVYSIIPAEAIDPDYSHPDTRHGYQKCYSIGCKNTYVARSIIQAKSILDSVVLNNAQNKQTILDHMWISTKLLLGCEAAYYKIYDQTMKLKPECDQLIEKGKKEHTFSHYHQIDDLNGKVALFLGNAKRLLEKTHELLTIFYNTPNFSENFQSYREWIKKNKPDNCKIYNLLDSDKEWIKLIVSLRNAHGINHAKKGNYIEIKNFELQPGNKFSGPSWKYDLSAQRSLKQDEYTDIILDMDVYMHNLCTFLEELFVIGIEDNWDTHFKFQIYKKHEEDIDSNCPMIYFAQANFI